MDQPFEVDLQAFIEVVSDHLYSDRRVAIRELLQNARDSLLQRRRGEPSGLDEPSISIGIEPRSNRLTIRDTGVGMTLEQARSFLAVLARSGTRLIRDQFSSEEPELAGLFAGRFGLGFVSTLMLASEVEVLSRTCRMDEQGIRFVCRRGSSFYHLEPYSGRRTGTEVRLILLPEYRDLLVPNEICDLVKHYCDLVEFPIRLEGDSKPINRMVAPWHQAGVSEGELVQFLREIGKIDSDPLFVAQLPPNDRYQGVLYLAGEEEGHVDLYVHHIFVNRSNNYVTKGLNFLSGMVDCHDLPLTLSRESAVDGPELEQLRQSISGDALALLHEAKKRRPRSYRAVLQTYGRHLKMAAIHDDEVMRRFGEDLEVKLISGQTMELREVVRQSTGQIAFVDDVETQATHGSLHAARGKPVVDASDRLDWILLQRYGSMNDREVKRADVIVEDLARPVEGERWRSLEVVIVAADESVEPRVVEVEGDLPALFLKEETDVLHELISQARRQGAANHPMGMFLEFLDAVVTRPARRTLLLNVHHPLVQGLADAVEGGADRSVLQTAIRALVAATRSNCEQLGPAERKQALDAISEGLLSLIHRSNPSQLPTSPRQGMLAMESGRRIAHIALENQQLRKQLAEFPTTFPSWLRWRWRLWRQSSGTRVGR